VLKGLLGSLWHREKGGEAARRGLAALQAGDLRAAEAAFRRALAAGCDTAEVYGGLGRALWEQGRLDEGLAGHEIDRRGNTVGGRQTGIDIVGVRAVSLILEIRAAGLAMAGTFGEKHGVAARHQPIGQSGEGGQRHVRSPGGDLVGAVIDDRQRERSVARRSI